MIRKILNATVFAIGLLAVCWIGVGYLGSNPLGAIVAGVIGACYIAGGLELYRYRQATASLTDALADTDSAPDNLGAWLERLPPSLRHAVRLRIEGERVPLPAPALTPYLVGLLVLLGMLGTLLGMMATLRGTGFALESATDLQAMRSSLAAPVKGLGFAFGTSIAGVATSAMLGLLASLCRRERLQAVQQLDARAATTLRVFSQAHQREETFKLLQRQSELMPTLVERLQAMTSALEQQGIAASERQNASLEAFHTRTEAVYTRLSGNIEQSLQTGVAESARAVGTALQPLMEATLAGLAQQTTALQASVGQAVQQQLDGLTAGLDRTAASTAQSWETALAEQHRSNDALTGQLGGTLDQFASTFQLRLEGLSAGFERSSASTAQSWDSALAGQREANQALASDLRDTLAQFGTRFEQHVESVSAHLDMAASNTAQSWDAALAGQRDTSQLLATDLRTALEQFNGSFEQRSQQVLEQLAQRLDGSAESLTQAWNQALARQDQSSAQLAAHNAQALAQAAATFEQHASTLVGTLGQSHAEQQAAFAEQDQARLTAWRDALATTNSSLQQAWSQAGAETAQRQQAICDVLAHTADQIATQSQAHASKTIAEISQLVQAASEAPRVAAEVIAELRQKLSDSMARDTALLDERTQMLGTLETLLDAVNHASTEQRTAIDALVTTSADLLERVGNRFTDQVQAESGKLDAAAAQVTVGATEVASLGDAFGAAVQLFGKSNEELVTRLQTIEHALDKSLARSDEQLAYYVAQAREVIDLSMLSQKQIIEELHQLSDRRAAAQAA